MKIHSAKILQIMPAPGMLADAHGNLYIGYALVELEVTWDDAEIDSETVRDILPFGADGGLHGLADGYYYAHGLGDERPPFAEFIGADGYEIDPLTNSGVQKRSVTPTVTHNQAISQTP